MLIWVLTDDRVGSTSQSMALANSISGNVITKKIVYNKFARLPNFIRGATMLGVDRAKSDRLDAPYPNIIIAAGRRLAPVALHLKNLSGNKIFVAAIMDPDMSYDRFDLVILPKHDSTPESVLKKHPNIIETQGSINMVNREKIMSEAEKWNGEITAKVKRPYISVILGGDTKSTKFDPKRLADFFRQVSEIANNLGGSLLISTSRRTSPACILAMYENLSAPSYVYDWQMENDETNKNSNSLGNPYFAYLGLSDFICVTGDSMSMVSEACSTAKPVYIYMPDDAVSKKHRRFCQNIIDAGYARKFDENTKELDKYDYEPLNEAKRIAQMDIWRAK